jgi:hypothetical protein
MEEQSFISFTLYNNLLNTTTMTLQERISMLLKARKILHKQEDGETITSTDIVLAHDILDMVVDDLIDERFKKDNIK